MGRSWINDGKIPPYHRAVASCGKCGLRYEDPTVYQFIDKGWDFFIDNLEPQDSFMKVYGWECPTHGRGIWITCGTEELVIRCSKCGEWLKLAENSRVRII